SRLDLGWCLGRLLGCGMDVRGQPWRRGHAAATRDDEANRFLLLYFMTLESHDDTPVTDDGYCFHHLSKRPQPARTVHRMRPGRFARPVARISSIGADPAASR